MFKRNLYLPLIFIFLLLNSCRESGYVVSINPDYFTPDDQIKIGNFIKERITSNQEDFPILSRVTYPDAYTYVETLLATLAQKVEHRTDYDWQIFILENDNRNTAFTLPGGYIYIYTGLLKFLDTESQLLSVIGHEMYYADTDKIINRLKAEYDGVTLGDILLDNKVENADEIAKNMPDLAFTSDFVKEADSFSVELLCPFLYDSRGIVNILEKADTSDIELEWVYYRPGDFNIRIDNIMEKATLCGEGTTNTEAYQNFLDKYLP